MKGVKLWELLVIPQLCPVVEGKYVSSLPDSCKEECHHDYKGIVEGSIADSIIGNWHSSIDG